jgi:hypothetical protein
MSFSSKQIRALRQKPDSRHVHQREHRGRTFSYVESWHAISEANRIFGFDSWDRETIEARNIVNRESKGTFVAVYMAKVRVTVRASDRYVVREGHGSGEGRGASPGEAHDLAIKAAETDATKRALATFGRPFGLGLYLKESNEPKESARQAKADGLHSHEAPRTAPVIPVTGEMVQARRIDKSELFIGAEKRLRDRDHLRYVARQPCLICGRSPSDPHHIRFAQLQALGRKVSDEFTVPLCRAHHREVHRFGDERSWWNRAQIDPITVAGELWQASRGKNSAMHLVDGLSSQ